MSEMAVSDPTFKAMLESLDSHGIEWAVLSRPAGEGGGDLDLAVGDSAPVVVRAIDSRGSGIRPVMVCEYGVGGAHAIWFADKDRGVVRQLDVLADAGGVGRLGLPIRELLNAARGLREIPQAWAAAYRVSKSLAKSEWGRLADVRSTGVDDSGVLEMAFGRAAPEVRRLLQLRAAPDDWRRGARRLRRARNRTRASRIRGGRLRLLLLEARRIAGRIGSPVGVWVHVTEPVPCLGAGPPRVDRIAEGIDRVLAIELSGPAALLRVLHFRLRPGVVVSWGRNPPRSLGVSFLPRDRIDGRPLWTVPEAVDGLADRVEQSIR